MYINWKLLSDNKVIIDEVNKKVDFQNNILTYEDKYGVHTVFIDKKIYERKSPDNIFRVNFFNNTLDVIFDKHNLTYDIVSKFSKNEEEIRLYYSLGDEEKMIIITKGESNER